MAEQYPDYTRRLERLLEVCRNLSADIELMPLLQLIGETGSDLTRSERTLLLVYEKESNCLRVVVAPFYLLESLRMIAVPLEKSIAGMVFKSQQPFIYHKGEKAEEQERKFEWEAKSGAETVLTVPLVYHGEIVGVLECWNKSGNAAYTEQDLVFLETLAAQAAAAFQNNRLIQEAEVAYRQVMELDRLKTDFIAIASHELRTPLGLILGHAAFLNESASAKQREDVDIINESANHLKELIEEFGNIDSMTSGLNEVRHETVALPYVIKQVVDSFAEAALAKHISLSVEAKQANLTLQGDGGKITIVLLNLVKNALTFTKPGGVVKVTSEQLPGFIKIAVADNGIGIPQSEQENIFKRFYQVENHLTRKHGGLGLGLSIAREMVEKMGGKIWVESVEGKGSRFSFLLPLNSAQASAAAKVFLK